MKNSSIPEEGGPAPDRGARPRIFGIVPWLWRLTGIDSRGRHFAFLGLVLALAVFAVPSFSPQMITIYVSGKPFTYETNLRQIGAILEQAGMRLRKGDVSSPPAWEVLGQDGIIKVRPAIALQLKVDGTTISWASLANTVAQALEEAGIQLATQDEIWESGRRIAPYESLDSVAREPEPIRQALSSRGSRDAAPTMAAPSRGITLEVKRAFPVSLHEGGFTITSLTTADTIGGVLSRAGVMLYPGDLVSPDLETRASAGMHVFVRRAREVQLAADGKVMAIRTAAGTVEELLYQQGVSVGPLDKVEPSLASPLRAGVAVKVTRVREEVNDVVETVPAPVTYTPDPNIELDTQVVLEPGRDGLRQSRVRVVYEDGKATQRIVELERLDPEPKARVIAYGTKIVLRQLATPEGTLTYWRHFRAFVTSYDASQGGKPKGHPAYGITATGMPAGYGVVAVDPRVISLYSRLYVPGYGTAVAGDTGGGVKGRMVDLGYPEGQWNGWSARWADVYLLAPMPPAESIRWLLPD